MPDVPDFDRAMRGKSRKRAGDGGSHPHSLVAWLASRQHGVASRRQLLELGIGPDIIDRMLATGRLHVIHRGVYAVGHRLTTREGIWMAAVLTGGEGTVLSHRSAAELWRILKPGDGTSHVTITGSRRSRRRIRFHSSPLASDEVTIRDGFPVTTVARTLLDIAPTLSPVRLKSAIDSANNQHLSGPLSVAALLERYPRRAGAAALKRILADGRVGMDVPREELELRFAEFIERFGVPRPSINTAIEAGERWFEVDCAWHSSRLVVELDSRRHHDNSSAFEEDRARDQALMAAGWRVLRITWRQLRDEPQRLVRTLNQALATLNGGDQPSQRSPSAPRARPIQA
jgi:predicted transcriptional regulator of viral defense system